MKKFYTEQDVESLFKSGIKSLSVGDDVALTDLAYEKAKRLGLQLLFDGGELPLIAPIRPYLSSSSHLLHPSSSLRTSPKVDSVNSSVANTQAGVAQRIRSAVLARLGNQVDAKLLDVIIQRVLKSTGVK